MVAKALAHPYANALFEIAKSNNKVNDWLNDLNHLAQAANNAGFSNLVNDPGLSKEYVLEVLISVGITNTKEVKNFLIQLQDNKRFTLLPAIFSLFEHLVLEDQKSAKGTIASPYPLNDADKKDFEKLLTNKFGKTITLDYVQDSSLIGGVKIFVNDAVIDASIKGSLEKMASELRK